MRQALRIYVLMCVAGLLSGPAAAGERFRLDADEYYTALRQSAGRPNEKFRWMGLWSYSNGRLEEARKQFERAAYYGDKPSQYLLGRMSWEGEGGAKDPVAAYIWTDLASERGTSREVLAAREHFWSSLTSEQREQVYVQGPAYRDRYSDAVAKLRTNSQLVRFSRNRTGSRTGSGTKFVTASLEGADPWRMCGGVMSHDGGRAQADLYASGRLDLDEYWRAQDAILRRIALGDVRVGDLERVRTRP